MGEELLIAAHPCAQCLTTKNRIVPGARAAAIVKDCRENDRHFRCHKGDIAGQPMHCRGVHDITGGDQAYRFARAIGIPIRTIDPDTLTPA